VRANRDLFGKTCGQVVAHVRELFRPKAKHFGLDDPVLSAGRAPRGAKTSDLNARELARVRTAAEVALAAD